MKIHNIRHGFATNSSSSHSILILPKGTPLPSSDVPEDYGWDNFTLADICSKQDYLRVQVGYLTGTRNENDPYVDYQSQWDSSLRVTDRLTRGSTKSPEVLAFLHTLLSMDRVVVLGGNDNSEGHPLSGPLQSKGAQMLAEYKPWLLVRDPLKHYVLFNSASGTKIRLTETGDDAPEKGTWPELVDIKITDHCPYQCNFCYQDSTPQGLHASLEYLQALAARFKESGVLEVAIGGGEPTLHPDFERIVEAFHSAGVIVNVTSRNVNYWAGQPKIPVTAVAFSVDSAKQIKEIRNRFEGSPPSFQVHFQAIVGTIDMAEFELMMDAAKHYRLTLLGYKDTGRGLAARGSLPIHQMPSQTEWVAPWVARVLAYREAEGAQDDWWTRRQLDAVVDLRASGDSRERMVEQWEANNPFPQPKFEPNLAIDTTLASLCRDELGKAGVPPVTYHTNEGAFSLYIDAVKGEMGPCSYAPALMRKCNLDTLWDDFAKMPTLDGGHQ